MIAVLLGVGLIGLSASAAAAQAPVREVITGQVLRLVSVQDRDAMQSMDPGEPVAWDVQVSASRSDGEIDLSLTSDEPDDAFRVQVSACTGEGVDCGEQLLAPTVVHAGTIELGTQPAADAVWYRISTELVTPDPEASTLLTFTANGHGEDVSAGGPGAGEPGAGGPGADGPGAGGPVSDGGSGADLPSTGVVVSFLVLLVAGVLVLLGSALRSARRSGSRSGTVGGPS
ncbi:hypothetical protein [Ruania halotolerans]|uniref:hypothetical protein n=1 Tax=Ruania halotolerans TaxID=2897773 RepID=UPI001E31A3B7|nr:hypothetical protein [Ruania halotolerans]UFU06511.1 hypothetical protein LQF10_19175 [Ruania halotolerans]